MSVCAFRADKLCPTCALLGEVQSSGPDYDGRVVLAIEANDLCKKCAEADPGAYIQFLDPTEPIAIRVRKNSPWLRRQRWRNRWLKFKWWFINKWERFDRWNHYGCLRMPRRDNMYRCTGCGFNYLAEDLEPVSGDGDMCAPCLDKYDPPRNGAKEMP